MLNRVNQIDLVGCPVGEGGPSTGCRLGPDALRHHGLVQALRRAGRPVWDRGNLLRGSSVERLSPISNPVIHDLSICAAWIRILQKSAYDAFFRPGVPLFVGGDHLMAAGTLSGIAHAAAETRQGLFVLWIDAHADFHTLETTRSGNLHGTPLAYVTGSRTFEGFFPDLAVPVRSENICVLGARAIDRAESERLVRRGIELIEPAALSTGHGWRRLDAFLDRVRFSGGHLHLSFDVDALDPDLAPGVNTPEMGGLTYQEISALFDVLQADDLVASADVAELNPLQDENGRTADLLVQLACRLFRSDTYPPAMRMKDYETTVRSHTA